MAAVLTIPEKKDILEILRDEYLQFHHLHQHPPIGREFEDVVDNALMRIQRFNHDVSYSQVSDLYTTYMTITEDGE